MDQEQNLYSDAELEILDEKYQRNIGLIERLTQLRLTDRQIAILEHVKSMLIHPLFGKPDSHQLAQELSEELEIEHELAMVRDELDHEPTPV